MRRSGRAGAAGLLGLCAALVMVASSWVPPRAAVAVAEAQAVPAAQEPPVVSLDLPYVAGGDTAQRLDLFVPGGTANPRPLVIFVHGGAWKFGSKSVLGGGSGERSEVFLEMLLRNGYAVASVEYRFIQVARFPAQINDVKAATRFLRSRADEFHLDPTRFAVAGESAGGQLAQLLGFTGPAEADLEGTLGVTGTSSAVSAVVSYYGVSELSKVVPDRLAAGCPRGEDGAASPEGQLIGGDPEARSMKRVVDRANPITHVGLTSPPTLLLHGTRDCLVPPAQSQRLYRVLRSYAVDTEYIQVDAPHGGPDFHTSPAVTSRVLRFLDRTLGVER